MTTIPLSKLTAEPFENQFWSNFDGQYNLSEVQMREELPYFITDMNNRMKVEALLGGNETVHLEEESTKQLSS